MAKTFREDRWSFMINPDGTVDIVELVGHKKVTDLDGDSSSEPFYIGDRWQDIPPGVRSDIVTAWTSYRTWIQSRRT